MKHKLHQCPICKTRWVLELWEYQDKKICFTCKINLINKEAKRRRDEERKI